MCLSPIRHPPRATSGAPARRRVPGAPPAAVDQDFSLVEWQVSLQAGNRFGRWEPSAGVRVFRQFSTLHDGSSGERVSGRRDGVSPFAGLRFSLLPGESIIIEVAALNHRLKELGLDPAQRFHERILNIMSEQPI